jgi:hypothetical protein
MPDDFDAIVTGLRAWTKDHDPHVNAAVGLLIWHEHWLRRESFRRACVVRDDHDCWIRWDDAREFCESRPRGSTSELAILDLAVALGENRYRLSSMGSAHSRAIADFVAQACGVSRG